MNKIHIALVASSLLAFTACGGGGGSSSPATPPVTAQVVVPVPTTNTTNLISGNYLGNVVNSLNMQGQMALSLNTTTDSGAFGVQFIGYNPVFVAFTSVSTMMLGNNLTIKGTFADCPFTLIGTMANSNTIVGSYSLPDATTSFACINGTLMSGSMTTVYFSVNRTATVTQAATVRRITQGK